MQETSWTAAWKGGGIAWKEPNIPSKKSAVLKFWKYRINLTGKRNCLQFYRLKKEKKSNNNNNPRNFNNWAKEASVYKEPETRWCSLTNAVWTEEGNCFSSINGLIFNFSF